MTIIITFYDETNKVINSIEFETIWQALAEIMEVESKTKPEGENFHFESVLIQK